MMSSTERFVVVVGVCLLVINVLLFGLCLVLVLDSQVARNENAQVLALTYQMLEKQAATPVIPSTTASSTVARAAAPTTPADEARPSSEEPVAVDDRTTAARSEELDTEGTESGAVVVTGTPGVENVLAVLAQKIESLRVQLDALKEKLNGKAATTESPEPTSESSEPTPESSEPTTESSESTPESSEGRRRRRRR